VILVPESIEEAVGLALKAWRKEQGTTATEMAARAGVSRTHYWRIETGQTQLSLSRLIRIAGKSGTRRVVDLAVDMVQKSDLASEA